MSWSTRIREVHRWTSIIFTGAVIFVTLGTVVRREDLAEWIYYLPLPPLGVLLFTGLYLFVLPYVADRRSRRELTNRSPT